MADTPEQSHGARVDYNDLVARLRCACADSDGPLYGSDLVPIIGDLCDAVESVHPRVWKLVAKSRNFIVIGEHEPYYLQAYAMIRECEMAKGTWSEDDRVAYSAARLSAESVLGG